MTSGHAELRRLNKDGYCIIIEREKSLTNDEQQKKKANQQKKSEKKVNRSFLFLRPQSGGQGSQWFPGTCERSWCNARIGSILRKTETKNNTSHLQLGGAAAKEQSRLPFCSVAFSDSSTAHRRRNVIRVFAVHPRGRRHSRTKFEEKCFFSDGFKDPIKDSSWDFFQRRTGA